MTLRMRSRPSAPSGRLRGGQKMSRPPPGWSRPARGGQSTTSTTCRSAERSRGRDKITINGTGPDQVRDGVHADSEGGKMTETTSGSARASKSAKKGLTMRRIYTREGVHPYDAVTWERRDVVMTNWRDGSINFEQHGVEFPDFWSVNAAN